MKIGIKREGGFGYFPGLNKTVTIDTQNLVDSAERQELESLIHKADLPSRAKPTRKKSSDRSKASASIGADQQHYTITLEDGDQFHTAKVAEPINDPHLAELVKHLKNRASDAVSGEDQG